MIGLALLEYAMRFGISDLCSRHAKTPKLRYDLSPSTWLFVVVLIIYKYHSMSRSHGAHEQKKAAPDIGAASIETNITTAKSEKLTKAKLTALEKRLIDLTPKNADGTAPISLTYTQRKSA
jgi:hypothetical protein